MRREFTHLLFLILILLISSCSDDSSPVTNGLELSKVDREILNNTSIVQEAIEAWSASYRYNYPYGMSSRNVQGETVVDFLPEGILLTNQITGERTEPVTGTASNPGSIGYTAIEHNGRRLGFCLTVAGETGELIYIYTSGSEADMTVRFEAIKLLWALNHFKNGNYSKYPDNFDSEVNEAGNTVLDYLSGRCWNPHTGEWYWPVLQNDGEIRPGVILCSPIIEGEDIVDIIFTGYGKRSNNPIFTFYSTLMVDYYTK